MFANARDRHGSQPSGRVQASSTSSCAIRALSLDNNLHFSKSSETCCIDGVFSKRGSVVSADDVQDRDDAAKLTSMDGQGPLSPFLEANFLDFEATKLATGDHNSQGHR